MLQTRSYTVGKTKHMANKKLHGWQNKTCCEQVVTRLAKQNMLQAISYCAKAKKNVLFSQPVYYTEKM
jgi:hypothetical protein